MQSNGPYAALVRRRILAGWEALSNHELDRLPLARAISFRFEGDHALAADLQTADELRDWLRALFARFPRLRFEVEDMVVSGPPWSLLAATRYVAVQDGETVYRGAHFARVAWGRITEERVLPDTQALARIAPRDAAPAARD